jgi:phosphate transport system substrate-binding protein
MKHSHLCFTLLLFFSGTLQATDNGQRHPIYIVGSSTLFPMISSAAESLAHQGGVFNPQIEIMGSGGGFKAFCSGIGLEKSDITMASRPIKPSERTLCSDNGIANPFEITLGFGGVVFANAHDAPQFQLKIKDLYLALARQVPDPNNPSQLIDNPYHNWQEINPDLPDVAIRVYGPPPTSGSRDFLAEHVLEPACINLKKDDDSESLHTHCMTLREDGAYINAGENEERMVRKLISDPNALGIMGFNYLESNNDTLKAAHIDQIEPTFESISSHSYPLSRPLFLYVKREHLRKTSGLGPFLESIMNESLIGDEGLMVEKGLIPLSKSVRQKERDQLDSFISTSTLAH